MAVSSRDNEISNGTEMKANVARNQDDIPGKRTRNQYERRLVMWGTDENYYRV